MPAYPTLPISAPAKMGRNAERYLDRASNGSVRARVFATVAKRTFEFEHQYLTDAQKATLDAFYAANLAASFTFVWPGDGVTYTCIFASEPQDSAQAANYTTVSVSLAEV